MPLLSLIFTIVLIGVVMWAVNTFIPMEPPYKNILNVIVLILVVVWLISLFVPLGYVGGAYIGRPPYPYPTRP